MSGNDFRNFDSMAVIQRQQSLHFCKCGATRSVSGLETFGALCSLDRNAGSQIADRKADAAKATAEPAIEIEKAKMQPCGNCDGNDAVGWKTSSCKSWLPKLLLAGFFECEYRSRLRHPISVGNRDGVNDPIGECAHDRSQDERTYSDEEIQQRLKRDLPHWYLESGWIRRKYRTNSWKGTLMVINTVGHLAEAPGTIRTSLRPTLWVEVRLQNHAAKGITDKDFELAKKIEDVIHWQPGKEGGALEGTPEKDQRFAYLKYDS